MVGEAEARYWDRALELSSMFISAQSFLLYSVEPGGHHLKLLATHDIREDEVKERRRDVRRPPYSDALNRGLQLVKDDYMKRELGLTSLLVPIIAISKLLGFLVINVNRGRAV